MSWQDSRLWAALLSVEGVGRVTHEQLILYVKKHDVSAEEFWRTGHRLPFVANRPKVYENFRRRQQMYSLAGYDEQLRLAGIQVVTRIQETYPKLLSEIPDLPPVLFVKGPQVTKDSWGKIPVAVVGTRHATAYGRLATEKIVGELSEFGATIISGFMTGIDLLAHQTALKEGAPTIGVLGFGFDHVYPAHLGPALAEFLAQGQTLVTEFAPEVKPTKGTFPQRNRVVAGLARATLVVEAAEDSGSLITAGFALEYNREIFAVPGPFNSIYSQGTTWLLNQGARLVTSGRQVLEELEPMLGYVDRSSSLATDGLSKTIYTQLQQQPRTESELELLCQKPLNQILATLSMMEVAGCLKQSQGRWVVSAPAC